MTKFFTTRNILSLAGLVLLAFLLSFSDKKTPTEEVCAAEGEPGIGNELLWESLSRQFSGSVSTY